LRLPVVSYALPALIAIGYARHFHAPSRNPLVRFLRQAVTERVFRVLESIQPPNGGFLEATPLTSFVLMSLAGSGRVSHPVARRCLDFILKSAQPDGSWKIDTNLSTFVTTLSTQAMAIAGPGFLSPTERRTIQDFLLRQQYRVRHLYTNAAPGGWAWTPLPGGVPDADDTAGALVALKMLELGSRAVSDAARSGVDWLLGLQNRDGGVPTFCRGWGKLPFDRSSPDITAHALRAWASWERDLPVEVQRQVREASSRAIRFLKSVQEPEGSWTPLWFGNQCETDEANRTYGTSRVALALAEMKAAPENLRAAVQWLLSVQREDGGWNGGSGTASSSTEETGLALEALCASAQVNPELRNQVPGAIHRGLEHLLRRVEDGSWTDPAPIGFYFAKLWYFEKLYPVVFAVAALERAKVYLSSQA
jgi:squalene-hopene/tetraprenyl-beta-curcumene cyclase